MVPVKVHSPLPILKRFRTERRKENIMASIHGFKKDEKDGKSVGSDLVLARKEILEAGNFDFFTSYTYFDRGATRTKGEYRLGNSVGVLDFYFMPNAKNYEYCLVIKFTDLDEAVKLHDLIRAGKIWPVINYDDSQVPSPCRHLKDIFHEAIGIIRRELARKLHFA